jgi:hypothetical protein
MEYKPGESELFDYMEGNLPAEQHAAIKKYLEEHTDCLVELEAAQRGAEALARFEVKAEVDLVANVMQKIDAAPTPASTGYMRYILLAAGALLIIIAGLLLSSPETRVQTPSPVAVPAIPEPEVPAVPPAVIAHAPESGRPPVKEEPTSPAYSEVFELAAGESRIVENQKIGTIKLAGPGSFVVSEDNVQIARGHAFIEIKKRESAKPFTVTTDDAEIIVVGTSFGVIKELQSTEVALLQGRLRIEAAGAKHDLESSYAAVISGSAYAASEISDRQSAFWADFPASLNRPPAEPENDSGVKMPDETNEHDAGQNEPPAMSPGDLLKQMKIEGPKED